MDTTKSGENEEKLQIACVRIECKCGDCDLETAQLYLCQNAQCESEYFCEDCGEYFHRKKSKKNHSFDIESTDVISLNNLLVKKEDTLEFNYGKQQIIDLIGLQRYNQIAPYVEKPISLILSNGPMCAQLMYELNDFFNAAQKAIEASKAAQYSAKWAKAGYELVKQTPRNIPYDPFKLVQTPDMVYKLVKQTPEIPYNWGRNIPYKPPTGLPFQSYPVQCLTDLSDYDAALMKLNKVLKSETLRNEALKNDALIHDSFTKWKQMDAVSLKKAKDAEIALNNTMSVKDTIKSGCIGMVIATAVEMGLHSFRYFRGDISGKEWCRLLGKTFSRNCASLIGTAVGGKFGAIVGCKAGITAGAFLGGATGIVIGILFGYLMGKGAEKVYEEYFPQQEKEAKSKLLDEALLYFNFQKKDIVNSSIFNEKALKKLFKHKALTAHPDRRGGDHSEWHRLSTYYGILKGLLEQNRSNKKMVLEIE